MNEVTLNGFRDELTKIASRSALIGTGVGALTGGGLGAAVDRKNRLRGAAIGALGGAAAGAGVGGIVGRARLSNVTKVGPASRSASRSASGPDAIEEATKEVLDKQQKRIEGRWEQLRSVDQARKESRGTGLRRANKRRRMESARARRFAEDKDLQRLKTVHARLRQSRYANPIDYR